MTELEHLQAGPFPSHIDPWVEQGRYFHQLHEQMIGYLLDQTVTPLFAMGYVVGRETSLQIAEKHLPDFYTQTRHDQPPNFQSYSETALALDVESGVMLENEEPELDAFVVRSLESGDLVTILEIVSPSNKARIDAIELYQARRKRLLERDVHVVELDLSRSNLRLHSHSLVQNFPYHIMIHLHDEAPYLIGMNLQETPKRFALPLHGEGIVIDLRSIYREAYAKTMVAWRIQKERLYSADSLPFPTLLSPSEREYLFEMVKLWQDKLVRSTP